MTATELLKDPFLQIDGYGYEIRPIDYHATDPVVHEPRFCDRHPCYDSLTTSFSDDVGYEPDHDLDYETEEFDTSEIDQFFVSPEHDHLEDADIAIKGKKSGDGSIFFRLRTVDLQGRVRKIYFPFDIENDTTLSVATEMVSQLDIIQQDATKIVDMIDGEIASLVPDWNKGVIIEKEKDEEDLNIDYYKNSTSTPHLSDYISSDKPDKPNLQILHCSGHASMHGRFEEVTYQVEETEEC